MPLPTRIATAKLARKLYKKGSCNSSDRPSNFRDKTNVSVEAGVRLYYTTIILENNNIISDKSPFTTFRAFYSLFFSKKQSRRAFSISSISTNYANSWYIFRGKKHSYILQILYRFLTHGQPKQVS